jgi:Tfp pilus assembly protein PilF
MHSLLSFFRYPGQLLRLGGVASAVFFGMLLLSNGPIVVEFLRNTPRLGFISSVQLFAAFIFSLFDNGFSLGIFIVLSLLIATNLLLLRARSIRGSRPLGFLGIVSGIIGVGCAACGTLLSGALVSLFGLTFVTATLPFQSIVLQEIGILFLVASIYLMVRDPFSARMGSRKRMLGIACVLLVLLLLFVFRGEVARSLVQHGYLVGVITAIPTRDPDTLFAAGNYYFGGGAYNLNKAEYFFRKALALDPSLEGPHYQLARIYFIQGDFPSGLTEINTELQMHPEFKRSYYVRGLIYGYSEEFAKAEEDFKEFLAWKPDSWAGNNDLAWIHFQEGEYKEAAEAARAGLLIAPHNPWLLNSLGVALLNMEDPQGAKAAFTEALKELERLTPSDWGRAYPGNSPGVYREGYDQMKASLQANLTLLSPGDTAETAPNR